MFKRLVTFYKKFNTDSSRWFPNYIFNKSLFRYCLALLVVLLLVALVSAPSQRLIYVNCPLGSTYQVDVFTTVQGCENPLYGDCKQDVVPCDVDVLTAGSVYGEPFTIPFFHRYFFLWVVLILGFAFLLNHYKFNKRGRYLWLKIN